MNQHVHNSITRIAPSGLARGPVAPAVLHAAAGTPSRIFQTRRGTFMIMVVGTLALLAVLTVLYVTVGKADRQTASSYVRQERTQNIPDIAKDYFAGVVGDGAVSLFQVPKPAAGADPTLNMPEVVRKSWDYPSEDWALNTYQTDPTKRDYFTPSGHLSGSSPYLASSVPTYLDYGLTNGGESLSHDLYKHIDDWGHLSNFAPDGSFVNLWNLRPEANAGGFDAPPLRMRENVALINNAFQQTDTRDFGGTVRRQGTLPSHPADLTMRQVKLFRETRLGNAGAVGPDNAAYMPYSYADTDGDGLYDARIFELRDYRDVNSQAFKDLLPQDPNFRWFFAARCIDLSGRVNVNTATEFFAPGSANPVLSPTAEVPSGVTPAEVDLLRLFTMQDAFEFTGRTYRDLYNPDSSLDPAYPLSSYDQDYNGPGDYNQALAYNIGLRSYDWLRRSMSGNGIPVVTPASLITFSAPAARVQDYYNKFGRRGGDGLVAVGTESSIQNRSMFTGADQLELDTYWTINDPTVMSRLESVLVSRPFLTYSGLNPASAERSVLRSNRALAFERDLSPPDRTRLRTEIDVRHNLTVLSGAREVRAAGIKPDLSLAAAADNNMAQILRLPSASTLQPDQFKRDVQGDLAAAGTTLPVVANPNEQDTTSLVIEHRQAVNDIFLGYADGLMPMSSNRNIMAQVWHNGANGAVRAKNRTRFYGYNYDDAPAAAAIASGFMAVNLVDMADRHENLALGAVSSYPASNASTMRTVLLNENFRTELARDFGNPALSETDPTLANNLDNDSNRKPMRVDDVKGDGSDGQNRKFPWAGWTDGLRLDLNEGKAATGRLSTAPLNLSASPTPPAINVYGVEASPFITAAASVTVYTDANVAAGGVEEGIDDTNGDHLPEAYVTIDTSTDAGNADLVMRVVAFQLSNPFDYDIVLSASGAAADTYRDMSYDSGASYPAIDSEQSFYYLEYAGHFYKLAHMHTDITDWRGSNLDPAASPPTPTLQRLTIPAQKSIVVYALNRPKSEIAAKMQLLTGDSSFGISKLNAWLEAHFLGTNARIAEIPEFIPLDAEASLTRDPFNANAGRVLHANTGRDLFSGFAPDSSESKTVMLWRANRAPNFMNPMNAPAGHEGRLFRSGLPGVYERNSRVNDQLVDSYLSTNPLDRHYDAPASGYIEEAYAGHEVSAPDFGENNFNSGLTVSLFSMSRRKDTPDAVRTIAGAIPAWCIKPRTNAAGWALHEQRDPASDSPKFDDFRSSVVGDYTVVGWYNKTVNDTTNVLPEMQMAASERSSDQLAGFELKTDKFYLNNNNFANPYGSTTGISAMRLGDLLLPMCIGPFETPIKLTASGWDIYRQTYGGNATLPGTYIADVQARWFTLSEALAVATSFYGLQPSSGGNPADLSDYLVRRYYTGAPNHPVQDRGHLVLDDFVPFQDVNAPPNATATTQVTFNRGVDYTVGLGIPAALAVLDQFSVATPQLTDATRAKPGLVNINTATRTVLNCMPMLAPSVVAAPNIDSWWWSGGRLDQPTDIPASILAYRDRTSVYLRDTSQAANSSLPSRDVLEAGTLDQRFTLEARADATQIQAISEEPGYRSVGELLATRTRSSTVGAVPVDDPCNIDFLGQWRNNTMRPVLNGSRLGIDTVLHQPPGGGAFNIDGLGGDYSEKIAIANQAFTATSVRSDYFAVYFMVMGFQRADVENLKTGEPLVPSVRRRYLMLIDRSNVTKAGDKPRIVAIKEVPIN